MSNQIYNEGRVVGYSAEELFYKLFKEKYPNDEIPTTKEWLSASMGMGASFAININKTTDTKEVITYNLRSDSSNINNNLKGLSGRYLIVATPIFGTATTYGGGTIRPITEVTGIESNLSNSYNPDVSGYSNILNGIVVYGSTNTTIKLLIDGTCTCNVLLTGFINAKILDVLSIGAGTDSVGKTYTDIDDFGNTLTPDISQIFFARPSYREYFKASIIDTSDDKGSLIDISQVNNNSSTLSTSASIITPASVHYANQHGKDVSGNAPILLSVQQHTNGSTKINPSLYFYNTVTNKLEPVDSDSKGAVNIIKRNLSPAETEAQLKTRIQAMTTANSDKIFIGAWVESTDPNKILYLILPGNDDHFEPLGDLLGTLKNSGEGSVRIYATKPSSVNTSYINYGIWD